MPRTWMQFVSLVWSGTYIHLSMAQTTSTLSNDKGEDVTLPCSLSGTFTFPEWEGPPFLTIYTIQDDPSGTINPAAPAASRLTYASNNRDLILSKTVILDSGDYRCRYTGLGDHTITLAVIPATTPAPTIGDTECLPLREIDKIFVIGSVVGLIIIFVVKWAITGRLPGKIIVSIGIGVVVVACLLLTGIVCCITQIKETTDKQAGTVKYLSRIKGDNVTLPCLLGNVSFPDWRGPNNTILTRLDDTSGIINQHAPAASRLQYDKNKRDLILSNALINDSGNYTCVYTGIGAYYNILTVNTATTQATTQEICECPGLGNGQAVDNKLTCGCAWFGICCCIFLVVFIIGEVFGGIFIARGNNDTSTNDVGTGSSPKNAREEKKVSKSPGKADNANKEKHASAKQHQHDDQPQPAGANPSRDGSGSVVSGRDVEVHETDNSFVKSQLPNKHSPGHDKKGRGLSANFGDDDHPLVGVDIPAQKAGTLPTLEDTPREDKKKTKKKKKKSKPEDKKEESKKT